MTAYLPRSAGVPWKDAPQRATMPAETRKASPRQSARRHYRNRVRHALRSVNRVFWARRPRRRAFGGMGVWFVMLMGGLVILAVKTAAYLVLATVLAAAWPVAWLADRLYG